MATVNQLMAYLEDRIPKSLSMPGDNDGFSLIPDGGKEVTKIMLALDVTLESIKAAEAAGAQLLVTHHPTIFAPLYSLRDSDAVGKRLIAAARAGIALAGFHTRLDAAPDGVNDTLCDLLGIEADGTFVDGLGRVGTLPAPISYGELAERLKTVLGTEQITGMDVGRPVHRIAVVGGSGKSAFYDAYLTGADTFLTGEAAHNTFLDARDLGMNIICATHYRTEVVVLPTLERIIGEGFPEIEVVTYFDEKF